MAGAGYKLFNTGDVLTAAQVNTYLQEQTVMVFADAAARTTALSGVLSEGMITYLKDTNAVEKYTGSAWVNIDTGSTSPLTTKGDLYTYSTTDTRLAVGNNGDILVPDSSTSTGLRWQGNYSAGKNAVLNSDFRIWQRGTSVNLANNTPTFLADRFVCNVNFSAGTASISQQTFTPGTAPVSGYEGLYFHRLNTGTTSTYYEVATKLEDVRTFAGQTVTISFWAKASSSITIKNLIRQNFGSGGSANVDESANFNITTSWVRYSRTLTLGSMSGKTIGTSSFLQIFFYQDTGALGGLTIDLWGLQLELGNTATAFQTATGTLAGELAACQRYYWRLTPGNVYGTYNCFGIYVTTDQWQGQVTHPVQMRVAPTVLEYGNLATFDGVTITAAATIAIQTTQTTPLGTYLLNTGLTGRTQYRPAFLISNNNTAGYLGLSAEL